MSLNPTQIPEKENAVRRLKPKINELSETANNDGKIQGRSIINRNISHESDTAIAQLNILGDANVIEQVARSTLQHKDCPNEGELDAEIVENRVVDDDKSNPASFTLKYKLRVINCIRFLTAINAIYGQNQYQRHKDDNKRNASCWGLQEEKKIVKG